MSFFFGDVLGEQKLGASLQVGSRVEDFAAQLRFLNRESRWNWGLTASVLPYVRGGSRSVASLASGGSVTARQIERLRQTHSRVAGLLAYPFSPGDTGSPHSMTAARRQSSESVRMSTG